MGLVRNQKGFTLVELTVGILISSIILFFITGMVISANNLFVANKERSENQQIGDAIYHYLVEELTYAKYLQLFPDIDSALGEATGSYTLAVADGMLYAQDENVFGEDFYIGRTVQFTAAAYNYYYVELTVTVLDKNGEEVYSTNSTVDVLNMRTAKVDIDDQAGGDPNPYTTYDR